MASNPAKWERDWWARRQDAIKSEQELRNKLIKKSDQEFQEAKEFFESQARGNYVNVPVYVRRDSVDQRPSYGGMDSEYWRYQVARREYNVSGVLASRICPRCHLRIDIYALCPGHPVGDENGMMPRVQEEVPRMEFDPDTVVDGSVEVRELMTGSDYDDELNDPDLEQKNKDSLSGDERTLDTSQDE